MSQIMEQAVVLIEKELGKDYKVSIDEIHCNGETGKRISIIPPDSAFHILYSCEDEETAEQVAERVIEDIRSGNTEEELSSAFEALLRGYIEKYDTEEEIVEAMKRDFGFKDAEASE